MIDMIYIAQNDTPQNTTKEINIQQSGLVHSKVAGRFEIVKELPKKTDSFDNMFNYADTFGKIKLAYINNADKISNIANKENKQAFALGAEFGFKSAEYNGFKTNILAYTSQNLTFINPNKNSINEDFFIDDSSSFTYIGEASIAYSNDRVDMKFGRIKIETPYANSDDIRLAPNTFEGAWTNINFTDELQSQVIYLKRWAGFDSQDLDSGASQHKFKHLIDEDKFGMIGASLTYEYAKNSELSFWYNYIDGMSAIAYAEVIGIYFIDGEGFHIDYGFQVSNIQELDDSGVEGNVLGALAILHYNGAFLGTSYNIAYSDEGKSVSNGFGGGPYYTSLAEATISAISEGASSKSKSNNDAEVYRIALGYELENIGLNGLVIEGAYGELSNDLGSIIEKDFVITYEMNEKWNLEATYINYKSSCDNNSFDRTLVKVDYSF